MLYQNKNKILLHEEDTKLLAQELCNLIKPGPFIICFYGDFGVGKTFLSREIIKCLFNEDIVVTSPTFNLLNIYVKDKISIYHYDLHRLKNCSEAYELSIEEALENYLTIIEWPQIIENILPKENRINIEIKYNINGTRSFRVF